MSAKGSRIKKVHSFSLAKISTARLEELSDVLEVSKSEIVDRALKLYYQRAKRKGWLDKEEED